MYQNVMRRTQYIKTKHGENMISLWSDTNTLPPFLSLEGDVKTDVLIIGGGMAGILCSRALTEAGVDNILLEARKICGGITGGTTAKISSQHGLIYADLIRKFGVETAKMYLSANERAIESYREIAEKTGCPIESKSSFIYSRDDRKRLEDEMSALERLKFKARLSEKLPLPFDTLGAVEFRNQAQFDPLRFVSGVVKNLRIYENSCVRELKGKRAVTDRGSVKADSIIVATHFPFINKHGSYFIKMYQDRSYVAAYENAPRLDGMYRDGDKKGFSFSSHGGYLLIGGNSHRTGKGGDGWKAIERLAKEHYPDAVQKYRWAAEDCMTLDGLPYIGRYSALTDGMYAATGFNKWGMTSSMVAAGLLCDLITGKKSEYAELYSPSRSILHPQLAVNTFESLVGIVNFGTKRCPHLGCTLRYNKAERSWDCPCHGSRFTEGGRLIDNPATGDLK